MIYILIPILNEVSNLPSLIEQIRTTLPGTAYNIVFVDDGSTDGSREFMYGIAESDERICVLERSKRTFGCERGAALIHGLKYIAKKSDVTYIIEMDGDLSHRPQEITTGIKHLQKGYDFVIASKYLKGSDILHRSAFRNTISYINTFLFRLLASTSISDYSNGFRFYNKKALEVILMHKFENHGPIYLGEVACLMLANKIKIGEFASVYVGRANESSKVILSDFFISIYRLLRIVWQQSRY